MPRVLDQIFTSNSEKRSTFDRMHTAGLEPPFHLQRLASLSVIITYASPHQRARGRGQLAHTRAHTHAHTQVYRKWCAT